MKSEQVLDSIAEGRPTPKRKYSFKSKTLEGTAAKWEIIEYSDDTIMICKIVIAKEEVPGYRLFRSFKWCKVLTEQILIKKSSLFTICKEVFDPSGGAIESKTHAQTSL